MDDADNKPHTEWNEHTDTRTMGETLLYSS